MTSPWSLGVPPEAACARSGTDIICSLGDYTVATPGNASIAVGAVLVVLTVTYIVFGLECAILLGCYVSLPAILLGLQAIFLSLVVLLAGLMLVGAGAVQRARARLPKYIV